MNTKPRFGPIALPVAVLAFIVALAALAPQARAQSTSANKKRAQAAAVKTAKTPAPTAAKSSSDESDGLDKDLPDIDETDFKNPHLYHPGQSSLLAAFGVSFPNQAEAAPRLLYGLEYYYRYRHNLTFGTSALYSAEHTKSATEEFKFNIFYLGFCALYDAPEQFVPGMHIGPAFYLVHVDYVSSDSTAIPARQVRKSALTIAIGPKVGFKFPLFSSFSTLIETAILYSPPIKDVGSFLTVNFNTGIHWDF